MAIVYTDNVLHETSGAAEDLNLGTTGDNVILPAGATLKTNKITDAGGNNIITSDGSGNLTLNGAFAGSFALINTYTPTAVGYAQITGLTSSYKCYRFTWTSMNVSTDGAEWQIAFRQVGGGFSGDTKTTTAFNIGHTVTDSWSGIAYGSSQVRSNTADPQNIDYDQGSAIDETGSGELYLFKPYNTTYVKQIFGQTTYYKEDNTLQTQYYGGFIDETTAIDGVQISPSSGTMTGVMKLYGFAGS